MLDLNCATIYGNIKDYEAALRYFDSAYIQYTKYIQWRENELNGNTQAYINHHFETPL